jgi:hypothetical protein
MMSKLVHLQNQFPQKNSVFHWRTGRLLVDGHTVIIEQIAKHILCEASVGPVVTKHLLQSRFGDDLHPQPGVQNLESGYVVMSVETGDIVGGCPSSEELSPVLFNQIVHQEFGVEAECKTEQVEVEVVFGVPCQSSLGDPRDESFECGGSLVCPVQDALSPSVWDVETEAPKIPTKPGCQSTVHGKMLHVWVATDGDCEVYAISSVDGFCQPLVYRMIRT